MARTVVIEDSTIITLLSDTRFAETIPCFMNKRDIFNTSRTGCGSCGNKKQERQRSEMARIKSCLASMSVEKKNEFKKLLGADDIRVVYANSSGQVVQHNF